MYNSTKRINEWPNLYSIPPSLFVTKLRTVEPLLSDEQIAEILQAIDSTCHYCWDTEDPCHCDNDE